MGHHQVSLNYRAFAVQSCLQQQQGSFYSNSESSVVTSCQYVVSVRGGRFPQAPLQPWVPPRGLMGPRRLTLPRVPLLLCQGGDSRTGGCMGASSASSAGHGASDSGEGKAPTAARGYGASAWGVCQSEVGRRRVSLRSLMWCYAVKRLKKKKKKFF